MTGEDQSTRAAKVVICNERGLHARAAAKFMACAGKFNARIEVVCGEETALANSIMDLLMLVAHTGATITIRANGPDAQEALAALTALVENRFGEKS